jgi:hypothetical protein
MVHIGCVGASTAQTPRGLQSSVDNDSVTGHSSTTSIPQTFADIGLILRLPARCLVVRQLQEEFPVWQIESPAGQPPWSMRVQVAVAPDPAVDLTTQAKAAVDGLALDGATVKIVKQRDLKVAGGEARVVWASAERGTQSTMAGWLLVRTGPGVFISVGAITAPADFAQTEPLLDEIFASASVQDPRQLQAQRNALVQRGDSLRNGFTPDRLRTLVRPGSELFRIWRPVADGATTEVGWMEMAVRTAPRSEASFHRGNVQDPLAREEGLLVLLTARMNSADGVDRIETQARFWVAWDLGAEAWAVKSVQNGSGPEVRFEQIGLRARPAPGRPGPSLIVSSQSGGEAATPLELEIPPVAYLPQAVAMLLGSLLPQNPSAEGEAIFYALDPGTTRLCQRPTTWRKEGEGPWTLITRNTPEAQPLVERFGPNGGRVDREEPDGTRTTPSSLEEIRKRWKALGLEP